MWVCDVYACITKQRVGGMLPQEIFREIRCSEIACEAILGQKQSRSSSVRYMARRILYPVHGCPFMHLQSQLTSNFHERRYYG